MEPDGKWIWATYEHAIQRESGRTNMAPAPLNSAAQERSCQRGNENSGLDKWIRGAALKQQLLTISNADPISCKLLNQMKQSPKLLGRNSAATSRTASLW
jgi:hypothetical protein